MHPNTFVSLLSSPLLGTWIGASPEPLLCLDRKKILRSVALAGTKQLKQHQNVSQVLWSHKEIEEQALVTKYIIECCKSIRLREFDLDGPRTVQIGELFHLQSSFTIHTKSLKRPFLADTILKLLHPTSAVCGIPKNKSTAIYRFLMKSTIVPITQDFLDPLAFKIKAISMSIYAVQRFFLLLLLPMREQASRKIPIRS